MYAILIALLLLGSSVVPQLGITPSQLSFQTSGTVSTTTIRAVEDAYVSAAMPDTNLGGFQVLYADGSPLVRTFLKFDVPALQGTVKRATLRVYAQKAHSTGFNVHPVASSDWVESKLTHRNAPAVSSTVLSKSGNFQKGAWVSVDVTAAVTSAGKLSLALATTSSTDLIVTSREKSNQAPQLVIETQKATNPAPTPSPTPSPTPGQTAAGSATVTPAADAFVSTAETNTNFGAFPVLYADGSPVVQTFMRFDVPALTGPVTRATLRLYAEKDHSTGFQVRPVASSNWNETQLTAANAPAVGSEVVAQSGKLKKGKWVTVDVTAAVKNTGAISLVLTSPTNSDLAVASRENQARAPQLIVESGQSGTTPDPNPSPTPSPTPAPSPTPSPTPGPNPPAEEEEVAPRPGTGGDAVAPGAMTLTSTYNSVGIELFFNGDDNMNAVANLEFKRSGDSNWRQGLPLWGTYDNPRAFYGSALLLDAGSTYDIRISFNDPDGINGNFTVTGSVATQAEDIPDAGSLAPTHFVSPQGSDAASGTSAGSAWQTLDKALRDAPSGAVVQVAPGSYAPSSVQRTTPISLVAQYAAVDDGQQIINADQQSIIEPQTKTRPGEGVWQKVSLTGPVSKKPYTLYKWTGAPVEKASVMMISGSGNPNEVPERVTNWKSEKDTYNGYQMETPEGWAEILYLNTTYNYGFKQFGNDIYVRLPGDRNPNDQYTWINRFDDASKMKISGPNIRYSGFQVRLSGYLIESGGKDVVIDHNLFYNTTINFGGNKNVAPSVYPTDVTIEYNRMVATGFWSDGGSSHAMPWLFIKGRTKMPGQSDGWHGVGKGEELAGTAIWGRGSAQRLVMRYNTVDGYFNGISGYHADFDRYSAQDTDIHDNSFRHIADDVFEPERQAINWRMWNNRIEDVSVAFSTGPAYWGPLYIFRNEVWRVGNHGLAPTTDGIVGSTNGYVGKIFKFSGASTPTARLYVVNNTFWTNEDGLTGGAPSGGGSDQYESFYLRNNVIRVTRYIFEGIRFQDGKRMWDEDYNYFFTSDPQRGMKGNKTIAQYRADSGQGAHTNLVADLHDTAIDSFLADPWKGDLRLHDGSPLVDAGTVVPNIADSYNGGAPDIGATER